MKNIKDVILANQENQGFMARVEHSLSIESLYSVLCEYGYSSDMNEFEQEIYDILKNSDLVKNSVPDDELEKVSGGVNMRQKIMSIVALIGLTVGATQNFVGAAPKHNVSVSKTTKTSEYKKPKKHTTPPAKELTATVTGGVVSTALLLSVLARIGNNCIKKQTFSNGTNTDQNNTYTASAEMQDLQLENQAMTYERALDIITKFHENDQQSLESFPVEVTTAVEIIERTFFNDSKPEAFTHYHRTTTQLKMFPKTKKDCLNPAYFKPLSWNNGRGDFVDDDPWMLYKAIFQYLCRMLSFLLEDHHVPQKNWKKDNGYVHYLRGFDYWGKKNQIPYYSDLFTAIEDDLKVQDKFTGKENNVRQLVERLQSMYDTARKSGVHVAKCGVFCGNGGRNIDN